MKEIKKVDRERKAKEDEVGLAYEDMRDQIDQQKRDLKDYVDTCVKGIFYDFENSQDVPLAKNIAKVTYLPADWVVARF